MSSDKGEEAFNFVDITPLDLWDPNGVRDLVTLEDDSNGSSMKEELEPSEWGENDDQSFWFFCGIPHCLLRETVYYFFQKLERVWEQHATVATTRRASNSTQKGMRELRNLIFSY